MPASATSILELPWRGGRIPVHIGVGGDPHAGRPLLFLNGMGAGLAMARPFLEALAPLPWVALDLPGCGGSPRSNFECTHSTAAALALALMDDAGIDSADVIGMSWGGAVALNLARSEPGRVRALILAATMASSLFPAVDPRVLTALTCHPPPASVEEYLRIAPLLYGDAASDNADFLAAQAAAWLMPDPQSYQEQMRAGMYWNPVPWLWLLRQPTLVMSGSDDIIVTESNARMLHACLPQAQRTRVEGGHLFLFSEPEGSACAVREFVQELH